MLKKKTQTINEEKRVMSISDVEKWVILCEESLSEESQITKKAFKKRITPFFKRKIKEKIIASYNGGLEEMD